MPFLEIHTSLSQSDIPDEFASRATAKVAQLTQKPAERIYVLLFPGTAIYRGGQKVDVVRATLRSIGNFPDANANQLIATQLTQFLTNELKLQPEQVILLFDDLQPSRVARAGNLAGK